MPYEGYSRKALCPLIFCFSTTYVFDSMLFLICISIKYFIYIGKLTAKCAGPHKQKVPVTLQENMDGTKRVSFKPIETGRHIMSIKYNKEHVLGKNCYKMSDVCVSMMCHL